MGLKQFLNEHKNILGGAFVLLLVILGITYTLDSERFSSNFPNALVAWGTATLAVATFFLIWSSKKQEGRRRQDELDKERRDRDERLLDEIIDWAVEVVKIGVPPMASAGLVGKPDEEADRRRILDSFSILGNNFRAMIAKSLYISRIGLAFGEELQRRIDELERDLRKQDDMIRKCLETIVEQKISEFDDAWKELIDNWGTLGDSAVNVVDEAVIEKLNILNI